MISKKKIAHGLTGLFIAAAASCILLPIVVLLSNSFMSGAEIVNRYTPKITPYNIFSTDGSPFHFVELSLFPDVITLQQYQRLLFGNPAYLRLFWNSTIIVLPVVLGQCLISPLGAYAFEELKWKYKEGLYFVYIVVMLMPLYVLLVPHFLIFGWLGIRDTYLSIILPGVFNPFGVFLIRQQLKGFPKECSEAARLDGASHWGIFRHIVMPNIKATLAALAILTFAEYWNVVEQAIVFIKFPYDEPLSVYLSRVAAGDTGMFFAVSCFYIFPAVLVFSIGQDYLVHGIALSGVKN